MRRVVSVVLVAALAAGVVVLSVLALDRVRASAPPDSAEPTFSFSPPVVGEDGPEPTPTEAAAPAPAAVVPAEERFLAVGSAAMWRATAGACGEVEPLVERSTDDGETWTDVTPRYRKIAQVRDLNAFAETESEMVADLGEDCETTWLRTFTQGRFWEPREDILAEATYVGADGFVAGGEAADAPCETPVSVRTGGGVAALVCDGTAHIRADGAWAAAGDGILALDVRSGDVVGATTGADCDGIRVVSLPGGDELGCVDGDPSAPIAVALTSSDVHVWSGDVLASLAR